MQTRLLSATLRYSYSRSGTGDPSSTQTALSIIRFPCTRSSFIGTSFLPNLKSCATPVGFPQFPEWCYLSIEAWVAIQYTGIVKHVHNYRRKDRMWLNNLKLSTSPHCALGPHLPHHSEKVCSWIDALHPPDIYPRTNFLAMVWWMWAKSAVVDSCK